MNEDLKYADKENEKEETNAQWFNIPHRKEDGTVTLTIAL
jgi:hypothetical protein